MTFTRQNYNKMDGVLVLLVASAGIKNKIQNYSNRFDSLTSKFAFLSCPILVRAKVISTRKEKEKIIKKRL